MRPHALVVAKAPVVGLAKTRLGATVGPEVAADLAAAALLDTLHACTAAFAGRCHLALEGDLDQAERSAEIRAALDGWDVFAQQGASFGARLAHAHAHLAGTADGVVQVGMDTPQVRAEDLLEVVAHMDGGAGTVLGPADDGGWWVLGLDDPARADVLAEVPMSQDDTYDRTVLALGGDAGVTQVARIRDVDTAEDAALVAALAPGTRFAAAWSHHLGEAS